MPADHICAPAPYARVRQKVRDGNQPRLQFGAGIVGRDTFDRDAATRVKVAARSNCRGGCKGRHNATARRAATTAVSR